jgi:hypothetical protein
LSHAPANVLSVYQLGPGGRPAEKFKMRTFLVGLLALALASCASVHRLDAANDVHALLVSIRDNDQAAFDAHVDRDALKGVLQAKLDEQISRDKRLAGLAALLGPSVVDLAGDALIQPQVFKSVAEQYGYTSQTQIPNTVVIASVLKELPDGRVCATKGKKGPCQLIFTKEAGVWKLTGFEGDVSTLRIKL